MMNGGADGDGESSAFSRAMEEARAEVSLATIAYRESADRAEKFRMENRKPAVSARGLSRRHVGLSNATNRDTQDTKAAIDHDMLQAKLRLNAARSRVQELRMFGYGGVISTERLQRRGILREAHGIVFTGPRRGHCSNDDCTWTHDETARTDIFVDYLRHIASIEIYENETRRDRQELAASAKAAVGD